MAPVYLDNNATTPLHAAVLDAMLPYLGKFAGNPSSVHRFGRMQRDAIEQARYQVAALVGARPEQVIFTSGGTEANNLLIGGFFQSGETPPDARMAVSAIEHMSILDVCRHPSWAGRIDTIAVDGQGRVSDAALRAALTGQTRLVSVMSANNETGGVQPVGELAALCRERGVYFHTDASQAAGKMPLDFSAWGLSAMTLSAHKFYGPCGAGALVVDGALHLSPGIRGGSQEKGMRAGTENVAAIVGFGKAAELARQRLDERRRHTLALREQCQRALEEIPGVVIFAREAERLPNTLQFGIAGFDGESLLMQLDRSGIAVSSGSACTSGKTEPSHVLQAMNVERSVSLAAIRVSFGEQNTGSDVTALLQALRTIIETHTHSSVMMAANL